MIENLKKVLKQDDTVLFIGSGISIWAGLPSWNGLIQELIDFIKDNGLDPSLVEQELGRGDLLQAASYGLDKLTKQQFAYFIRRVSRLGIAQPHEIHRKIIELGPNCYITTNYDKLLELSFQLWKIGSYFRTVINTQLTETAEIVGARANHFLFKLHGDAENSDSVILTREQYRSLNSGGELNHALETAKTLMLSRPIVYFGFGLRDPDFLYLKDLLMNTYKGGVRDHYAIMADIGEQEKDYWKRNFGIHLINYDTIITPEGKKDHTPLLHLVNSLNSSEIRSHKVKFTLNSDFILNLSRHSAKYSTFEISKLHLPLVVDQINDKEKEVNFLYYQSGVENLLDQGPDKLVLVGLPGGGKSYSLKSSVARLSKTLSQKCIDDTIKLGETIVPVYVDLKLYQGDLVKLVEQNIPVGVDLSLLCTNFIVKLYFDAFNEIPKEYIESKSWSSDFSAFLEGYNSSVIISSRTVDGLEELDFPKFNLDSINREFVKTSLIDHKLTFAGVFKDEVITLLQKPFFYKLIFEKKLRVDAETTPQKIYSNLISLITNKLNDRFNIDIKLINPLSRAAMEALDKGEEAFKIEILAKYIELELDNSSTRSSDIINWLVGQDFLIPLINERISFFHQSVTEYLAATRLSEIFSSNGDILTEKLRFRRWDQALFLCLSLLKVKDAEKFLDTVINIDFELALSAVKYLEGNRDKIIDRLLEQICLSNYKDFELQSAISYKLRYSIPFTKSHVDLLLKLIKKGNMLGGAAAGCLIDLLGDDIKNKALNLLVADCDDYNFCTEIGRSIKRYVTEDDISDLLALCKKVQKKINNGKVTEFDGFSSAVGNIMAGFNPDIVFNKLYNPKLELKQQDVQLEVLCSYLQSCRNNEGLLVCLKLLELGIQKVAFEIYFITAPYRGEKDVDYSLFESKHIISLIKIVTDRKENMSEWAISSLFTIFSNRPDLKVYVENAINNSTGVLKAAFYYSKSEEQTLVFQTLENLLLMDEKSLQEENFALIRHMKLNWKGHEDLFVDLLRLRNERLAYNMCDNLAIDFNYDDDLVLNIGRIDWWLQWFNDFVTKKNDDWMFSDRVPTVLSNYISDDKRREFLLEINNPHSKYRKVLNEMIIIKMRNLKLDDFTEETLTFLIDDSLRSSRTFFWTGSIIEKIATEEFVTSHLLPLLNNNNYKIYEKRLKKLIESIGKKHKRRYIVT